MTVKQMLRTAAVTLLVCVLVIGALPMGSVSAGRANEPIRILAIGNSFSNNATQWANRLAKSLGINAEVYSLYYAGCALSQHVNFYQNDAAKYDLYTDGKAVKTGITMKQAFALYDYDYVTVQQAPGRAADYSTYTPYLKTLEGIIRQNEPNAEIQVHQTWSFCHDCAIGNDPYYKVSYNNSREMYEDIKESYEKAAAALGGAKIVPVGEAIQLAKDEFGFGDYYNPGASGDMAQCFNDALYADYIDHLNQRGRYLAACVWVEHFFGVDCRKSNLTVSVLFEDECAVLREIAHEVVTGKTSTVYGNWRAVQYDDGMHLTHYVGKVPANGTLEIPGTVAGKAVSYMAPSLLRYVTGVKKVVLPANYKSIEIANDAIPKSIVRQVHTHKAANEMYRFDDTHHWQVCVCGEVMSKAVHRYSTGTGRCLCGARATTNTTTTTTVRGERTTTTVRNGTTTTTVRNGTTTTTVRNGTTTTTAGGKTTTTASTTTVTEDGQTTDTSTVTDETTTVTEASTTTVTTTVQDGGDEGDGPSVWVFVGIGGGVLLAAAVIIVLMIKKKQ